MSMLATRKVNWEICTISVSMASVRLLLLAQSRRVASSVRLSSFVISAMLIFFVV